MKKIAQKSKRPITEVLTPGAMVWSVLGLACLAGVIFAGAWWHLGTTAICGVMAMSFNADPREA